MDSAITSWIQQREIVLVERIVDGDTIMANNKSVRLLGINSPERGETYYEEASEFLGNLIFNKTVSLEFSKEKYDRYNRTLAYVFISEKNINIELIKNGFANIYFPSGKENCYPEFVKSWEECIKSNLNLCEKSVDQCQSCVNLKEFDYNEEKVIFENICAFDCELTGWTMKDQGRKQFKFPDFTLKSAKEVLIITGEGEDSEETLFWSGEDYIWTDSGDSLFLRDSEGKLVLYRNY